MNYQKSSCKLFRCLLEEKPEMSTEGAAVTISKPKQRALRHECAIEWFRKLLFEPLNTFSLEVFENSLGDCSDDVEFFRFISSSDIVLCIFCEGWPSCAQEWITRERLWPDAESVKAITHGGFHIVPKSSPDGDFRLSFTTAETMLIKTLKPLQFKVMKAFKAIVKYHQNVWNAITKEVVSSYHLKTITFWYLEKTSKEMWTEKTIVHHLVTLLEELAEALRIQNIPMYFMPKVNLLKYNDPEVTLDLADKILQFCQNFSAMSEALKDLDISCTLINSLYKIDDMFQTEKKKHKEKNKKEHEKCSECLFSFLQAFADLVRKKDTQWIIQPDN